MAQRDKSTSSVQKRRIVGVVRAAFTIHKQDIRYLQRRTREPAAAVVVVCRCCCCCCWWWMFQMRVLGYTTDRLTERSSIERGAGTAPNNYTS